MAMAERQQPRLKQTPKHLERMLFVNHKEEQNLQRRLEAIATDGRARGRELDMERIKVRNVWRYNSRLTPTHVAPLLGQIPTLIKTETQRSSESIDPVNVYLLREYRRNSQVIPSILSALNKEAAQKEADEKEELKEKSNRTRNTSSGTESEKSGQANATRTKAFRLTTIINSRARRNRDRKRQVEDEELLDGDGIEYLNSLYGDQPDTSKASQLVKEITKIRSDMAANKRAEIKKSRLSFQEMMRGVHEQEKKASESNTFTDGTCALLRRKMHRLRNPDDSDSALEMTLDVGKNEFRVKQTLPKIPEKRQAKSQTVHQAKKSVLPATRSFSTTPTISRQQALLGESEDTMKKQLEAQERYNTEVKVAREIEKFRRIQGKISDFLEKHKRKAVHPLLFEAA